MINDVFFASESLPSEDEIKPRCSIKNKRPEKEDDIDDDNQEAKRLKFDVKEEDEIKSEENESSCHKELESKTQESSEDACDEQCKSEKSCDTPSDTETPGKCLYSG